MSIVLKDGTVLPDIPNDYAEEYPYQIVTKSSGEMAVNSYGVTPYFQAFIAKSRMAAVPLELSDKGAPGIGCTDVEGYRRFYYSPGGSWEEDSSGSAFRVWLYNANVLLVELVWSNHDILTATAMDYDAYIYFPGTEIYFHNSLAKPPFVLPDGTELPALPEGCFEKYPYGVIMSTSEQYGGHTILLVSDSVFNLVPEALADLGQDMIFGGTGVMYAIASNDGEETWQLSSETGEKVGFPAAFSLHWSNHDILTATAIDDSGNVTSIGPDLYRKSDVNYRIYGGWLNSMGNQARRLGGVSGALKPGEMETVFSGATLEPLTVTPTTEEQTFTPESPCIGFSSVTVEAAEDTGGGDIVEPETYPDSEDVDFGYTGDDNPYTGKYFYGTWDFATNLPENPSNDYPYAVLADLNDGKGKTVSLRLCAEEPYYYETVGRVIWGVSKPAKGWYYDTSKQEWVQGSTSITGGNTVFRFYWSNVDIINNKTGAVQYTASEPVPEMKAGVSVGGIDNSATYTISGATLTALGLVTKQITGVTATTPSAMVSALQMYAGTH